MSFAALAIGNSDDVECMATGGDTVTNGVGFYMVLEGAVRSRLLALGHVSVYAAAEADVDLSCYVAASVILR